MKLSDVTAEAPALKLSGVSRAEEYGPSAASPRAQALKETIVGPGIGTSDALSRQQSIEQKLRAQGMTDAQIEASPEWQGTARTLNRAVSAGQTDTAIGGVLGDAAGAALEPVVTPLKTLARGIIRDVIPGGTRKAIGEVSQIAPITDKSVLGDRMVKSLRPNYDTLYAEREKALQAAAPSEKYISADESERRALNAARGKVYRDPKFADLRRFEESPLGKKIVADTTNYSNVPRLDPANLPGTAFKSAQTVRELRDLLATQFEHPGDAVESFASEHTAQALYELTYGKDVAQAARAVDHWMVTNRAWLNETPVTKALAQHYVERLNQVAGRQGIARPLAKRLGEGAALATGFEAWRRYGFF